MADLLRGAMYKVFSSTWLGWQNGIGVFLSAYFLLLRRFFCDYGGYCGGQGVDESLFWGFCVYMVHGAREDGL